MALFRLIPREGATALCAMFLGCLLKPFGVKAKRFAGGPGLRTPVAGEAFPDGAVFTGTVTFSRRRTGFLAATRKLFMPVAWCLQAFKERR